MSPMDFSNVTWSSAPDGSAILQVNGQYRAADRCVGIAGDRNSSFAFNQQDPALQSQQMFAGQT